MQRLIQNHKKNIKLLLEPIEDETIIINYYVIHMLKSIERKQNINLMENKLQKHINIFNAIDGQNITDINDYDPKLNCTIKTINKNILGCYLSHYLLIRQLINNNITDNYTVIFEDDFNINYNNLDGIIKNIISNAGDFDIIFLGLLNSYPDTNIKLYNNIYNTSHVLWGTHALLFNNKSLHKIYNELQNMNEVMDEKYSNLYKLDNFKILYIKPYLVTQNLNLNSLIGSHTI
jgi:GR25 family glycosyltransferase involved in LPS biosynthesis